MRRFDDPRVAAVFKAYPPAVQSDLMKIREMMFEVAAATPGVGKLTEALKWGQPSYLTAETGSGSIVRIDRAKGREDGYAVYFHCQSGLVGQFRELYPGKFEVEGERALHFVAGRRLPIRELRHCVGLAFTHHSRKRKKVPRGDRPSAT